jgi:hypothetical protein
VYLPYNRRDLSVDPRAWIGSMQVRWIGAPNFEGWLSTPTY